MSVDLKKPLKEPAEISETLIHLWQNSLNYLSAIIESRLNLFTKSELKDNSEIVPFPDYKQYPFNPFTSFLKTSKLKEKEIVVLIIAIANHFNPSFFDDIIQKNLPRSGDFPQLGGTRGKNFRGFLPTGETVLFILGGNDMIKRMQLQKIFDTDHFFATSNVLWLEDVPPGEPRMSGKIILSSEYLELFTSGKVAHPKLSMDFPARHVTTKMQWDDLVLNENTLQQIIELENWVEHHQTMMHDWGLNKKLKPGYRSLFYGPPGTGKTLTATLLGKYTGKEVFRIDLSMVVSKFIGETEKNLSQLFNRAENKNWILFFDEADALFSKRTSVRDAHDKYANQEAAYLLQRIESFDGLVILATNFKNNIDDAFIRRFQSVIHFPSPNPAERLLIWEKGFPASIKLADDVDLAAISKKFELTGSAIMSVVQHACLLALSRKSNVITYEMVIAGIRREYMKEGKIW